MSKTDLTFEELNAALGSGAIVYDQATNDVLISVKAITGKQYSDLSNDGVISFVFKVRSACSIAQNEANKNLEDGEKLTSFPSFNFNTPINGYSEVTQTQSMRIPLATQEVIGKN